MAVEQQKIGFIVIELEQLLKSHRPDKGKGYNPRTAQFVINVTNTLKFGPCKNCKFLKIIESKESPISKLSCQAGLSPSQVWQAGDTPLDPPTCPKFEESGQTRD